jgi:MFS family permease
MTEPRSEAKRARRRGAVWWRRTRFPAFVVSRFVSQAGDMAAITALTVYVYASTDSGLAVGALFVARVLPRILGLFAGAVGDRAELRRLMMVCDIVCGIVFLGIAALAPGYVALLALVFVAECAATVALPASRTMIGRVVPDEHRTADYRWALVANAGSFVISALLLTRLPAAAPVPRTTPSAGFRADTIAGLSVLRADRGVAAVTIGMVGIAFAASIDRPAMIVLVEEDLDAAGLGYGLALGGLAIGALAVSLAALRSKTLNSRAMAVFTLAVVVQAAGHLAMGLSPVVAVLVTTAVIAGVGNGLESVCGNTLLQRGTPQESLGVVMGVVLSGSFLANAIGSAIGGATVELLGARWTFVLAAAVMVVCAVPVLRRAGREPECDQRDPRSFPIT